MNKANLIQFIKYFITAGIATVCDWASYFVFYNLLGINEYIAAVLSFIVWFIVNYILSIIFVFKESKHNSKVKEITLVLLTSVFALGINMLCLWAFINILETIPLFTRNFAEYIPLFAKIIASGVSMVINFVLRKIFVFK